jgi:tetratricopeptide (TPR) repeat protein
LSQAQLAGDELTKGFISQLESGSVRPSIRSLQLIAGRLGKSLDYFLGDEPLSLQKRVEFLDLAAQAAFERSDWEELRRTAEEAMRLDLQPAQRASFLRWAAQARVSSGDNEAAFEFADEALRTVDRAGAPAIHAAALVVKGVAYANIGQIFAACEALETALDTIDAHEVLDVRLRSRLLVNLATAYRRLNRTTKAIQCYEMAFDLANRHSDTLSVARSLMGIAVSLYDSGEVDGAIANYRRALELFRRVADQGFETSVLLSLAFLHTQQSKLDEAERYARACRDRAQASGDARSAAVADEELARIALYRGDGATALDLAESAARRLGEIGDVHQQAGATRVMAAARHALGDHAASDAAYDHAIELAKSVDMFPSVSEYASEFAQRLRERGEYERAFHYLELARKNAAAV